MRSFIHYLARVLETVSGSRATSKTHSVPLQVEPLEERALLTTLGGLDDSLTPILEPSTESGPAITEDAFRKAQPTNHFKHPLVNDKGQFVLKVTSNVNNVTGDGQQNPWLLFDKGTAEEQSFTIKNRGDSPLQLRIELDSYHEFEVFQLKKKNKKQEINLAAHEKTKITIKLNVDATQTKPPQEYLGSLRIYIGDFDSFPVSYSLAARTYTQLEVSAGVDYPSADSPFPNRYAKLDSGQSFLLTQQTQAYLGGVKDRVHHRRVQIRNSGNALFQGELHVTGSYEFMSTLWITGEPEDQLVSLKLSGKSFQTQTVAIEMPNEPPTDPPIVLTGALELRNASSQSLFHSPLEIIVPDGLTTAGDFLGDVSIFNGNGSDSDGSNTTPSETEPFSGDDGFDLDPIPGESEDDFPSDEDDQGPGNSDVAEPTLPTFPGATPIEPTQPLSDASSGPPNDFEESSPPTDADNTNSSPADSEPTPNEDTPASSEETSAPKTATILVITDGFQREEFLEELSPMRLRQRLSHLPLARLIEGLEFDLGPIIDRLVAFSPSLNGLEEWVKDHTPEKLVETIKTKAGILWAPIESFIRDKVIDFVSDQVAKLEDYPPPSWTDSLARALLPKFETKDIRIVITPWNSNLAIQSSLGNQAQDAAEDILEIVNASPDTTFNLFVVGYSRGAILNHQMLDHLAHLDNRLGYTMMVNLDPTAATNWPFSDRYPTHTPSIVDRSVVYYDNRGLSSPLDFVFGIQSDQFIPGVSANDFQNIPFTNLFPFDSHTEFPLWYANQNVFKNDVASFNINAEARAGSTTNNRDPFDPDENTETPSRVGNTQPFDLFISAQGATIAVGHEVYAPVVQTLEQSARAAGKAVYFLSLENRSDEATQFILQSEGEQQHSPVEYFLESHPSHPDRNVYGLNAGWVSPMVLAQETLRLRVEVNLSEHLQTGEQLPLSFTAQAVNRDWDTDTVLAVTHAITNAAPVVNVVQPTVWILPHERTGQFELLSVSDTDGDRLTQTVEVLSPFEIPHATATLEGNVVTVTTRDDYFGLFAVRVTVSDGAAQTSYNALVRRTTPADILPEISDQVMGHAPSQLALDLAPKSDRLHELEYRVEVSSVGYEKIRAFGIYEVIENPAHDLGHQERWVRGTGNVHYFITAEGTLHRWGGSFEHSPVVATLDHGYYANPTLLMQPPATATLENHILKLEPLAGFAGELLLSVSVREDFRSDTKLFQVHVENSAPVLEAIEPISVARTQHSAQVDFVAYDSDADILTHSFEFAPIEHITHPVARQFNLWRGVYPDNRFQLNERWFMGNDVDGSILSFYLLPNGELYEGETRRYITSLDPVYHETPDLLLERTTIVPAEATVDEDTATFAFDPNFEGTTNVTHYVSDGMTRVSNTFALSRKNIAPTLAPIGPQTVEAGQRELKIDLSAVDSDSELLIFSARVEREQSEAARLATSLGIVGSTSAQPAEPKYRDAKWLRADVDQATNYFTPYYFIMPNGELYGWPHVQQVTTLDSYYYEHPEAIFALPATASVEGTALTLTLREDFVGTFSVTVSVNDGRTITQHTFDVTVDQPPRIEPVVHETAAYQPTPQTLSSRLSAGDIVVADLSAGGGSILRVNSLTGEQETLVSGGYLQSPSDVLLHTSGDLLVIDRGVIRVNLDTNVQTLVAPRSISVVAAALTPDGNVVATDSWGRIVRIDVDNGSHTILSSGGHLSNPKGIAVDNQGTIFIADVGNHKILEIDPTTGEQHVVTQAGSIVHPFDVAIADNGDLIVLSQHGNGGVAGADGGVVRVDRTTGAQTVVAFGGYIKSPLGVAVESDGNILVFNDGYWGPNGGVIRITAATGEQTLLSTGMFERASGGFVVPGASVPVANPVSDIPPVADAPVNLLDHVPAEIQAGQGGTVTIEFPTALHATFHAELQPVQVAPHELALQYGITEVYAALENYLGLGEVWFRAEVGNHYFYLTPQGELYSWTTGQKLADLDLWYFEHPEAFFQGTSKIPGTLTVTGSTLSVQLDPSFVGVAEILLTLVQDGVEDEHRVVRIEV